MDESDHVIEALNSRLYALRLPQRSEPNCTAKMALPIVETIAGIRSYNLYVAHRLHSLLTLHV